MNFGPLGHSARPSATLGNILSVTLSETFLNTLDRILSEIFCGALGWTARLCGTLDDILSETFGNTLGMSLSKTLGETVGKMLGEFLDKTLSETFGETLDNTLGEILREKMSNILDEIIDYPELYTYNNQFYTGCPKTYVHQLLSR